VDCVKLAGRKVLTWFLRQHPKVQQLPFKPAVKRQDRVNARVRYIEGSVIIITFITIIIITIIIIIIIIIIVIVLFHHNHQPRHCSYDDHHDYDGVVVMLL
jgi:amino acid transporter